MKQRDDRRTLAGGSSLTDPAQWTLFSYSTSFLCLDKFDKVLLFIRLTKQQQMPLIVN